MILKANPLKSKSGKLEIYCQARYDLMASFGFPGNRTVQAVPDLRRSVHGRPVHVQGRENRRRKGRVSVPDVQPALPASFAYRVRQLPVAARGVGKPGVLARSDAESLGIKDGDTVLLSSPYGKGLRKRRCYGTC